MYRLRITKKIANGGVVAVVVTTLLSAVFWFFPVFLFPADEPSVALSFMGVELFGIHAVISRLIAFFFWLAVWHKINSVCEKTHIIPVRTIMPYVMGMAIVAAIPEVQFFHSGMIAFAFFFGALLAIFDFYTVSNQVNESFKVVLLILISSLFVPEFIWTLGVFFLGLAVYKVRTGRIFLSLMVALLVFVWMVWGVCFSIGEEAVFKSYISSLVDFDFSDFHGRVVYLAGFAILLTIMIIMMIAVAGISHKFDARVRLNGSFVNLSFFFSVAIMVAAKGFNGDLLMITLLPVTMLSALYFSVQRNNFSNILFLVSLLCLLLFRVADGLIGLEI